MKRFAWMLAFLGVTLFAAPGLFAEEDDDAAEMQLLKDISAKQDQILSELEAVKTELNVVKIRVSSR